MGARVNQQRTGGDGTEQAKRPIASRGYYARRARSNAEARAIDEAAKVEGLGDEIAVLRVRLAAALNEKNVNLELVLKGVEVLTKAVATEYRLSPRATKDLAERFAAVLNSVGDQIFPSGR